MSKSNDWGRFQQVGETDEGLYIVGASEGEAGSGKTHFWLTAPDPIAYFGFDPDGLRGLRGNALFKSKDIRAIAYCEDLNIGKLHKDERVERSLETLNHFKEDWDTAVKKARTLVIDKESMLWEMLRYAHDEVESPDPKNFHELHLLYQGWVGDAMNRRVNLGLIRDVKDSWGRTGQSRNGNPQWGYTGVMKPEGNKKIRGLVHVALAHRYDEENGMFAVKIGGLDPPKCRLGSKKLLGKEMYDATFTDVAMKLYPESDEDDWS